MDLYLIIKQIYPSSHKQKNPTNVGLDFEVANSPTTIDCIIKKRLKREAFLNQPITNEYRNYDIEFLRVSD